MYYNFDKNRKIISERKYIMKITDVKVRKTFEEGPMKAIVSVTFDDCLAVHDIKVIETANKKFVVMPSVKNADGVHRDTVHPTQFSLRTEITEAVIEAYEVHKAIASSEQ